jgi:dUTP pyrophosphatase
MQIELKIIDKDFYAYDSGLDDNSNLGWDIPSYATLGSAGVDLRSTHDVFLLHNAVATIHTGIAIHIGSAECRGFGVQDVVGVIALRSSLGVAGLTLANSVGIIDADYQGEILLKAYNRYERKGLFIKKGERVAQLLFMPVIKPLYSIVDEFTETTSRGTGGFGSTGL